MLRLYYYPGSCALAAHIALEEAGATYELARVDIMKGEQQGSDYLALNPKGRVPALQTQRGVLTETPAILAYIAQRFPEAQLAPLDDAFAFAQAQSFISYLCSTVHPAHAHRWRAYRWADDPLAMADLQRKAPQNVRACFDMIEHHMFKGPWYLGDQYTICDSYLFTIETWLESDDVPIADFPKINDHMNRMMDRPAVRKVMPLHSLKEAVELAKKLEREARLAVGPS